MSGIEAAYNSLAFKKTSGPSGGVLRSKAKKAIQQDPVILCTGCEKIQKILRSFNTRNSELRRRSSMARPLTEVSNVYQNTMLVSTRDIEQVRNSIPEHPSQPDTDEWDAQTRNVTIRGPFSKSTCPSCSFIWKTLKPFGVHSKVTELCFRAESPAERAHCLAATLEGVVLYIAGKGMEIPLFNHFTHPRESTSLSCTTACAIAKSIMCQIVLTPKPFQIQLVPCQST